MIKKLKRTYSSKSRNRNKFITFSNVNKLENEEIYLI